MLIRSIGVRFPKEHIPLQMGSFLFRNNQGAERRYKTIHAATGVIDPPYIVRFVGTEATSAGMKSVITLSSHKKRQEGSFHPRQINFLDMEVLATPIRDIVIHLDGYCGADARGVLPRPVKELIAEAWHGNLLPIDRRKDGFNFRNQGVRVEFKVNEPMKVMETGGLSINMVSFMIGEFKDKTRDPKNDPRYAGFLSFAMLGAYEAMEHAALICSLAGTATFLQAFKVKNR
ncbi:MAG: hypothetical protein WC527_05590 [Candidatus Margulisiibacteriota bacterium]